MCSKRCKFLETTSIGRISVYRSNIRHPIHCPRRSQRYIQHVNNYFSYNAQLIDTSILEKLTTFIAYNHSDFQVIASSNNVNDATIWSKIANLDILKTYRTSNPTAKIGIQRIVENVHDPQFGFSVPIEKYLVFLVN